jgi:telomere length regulation protein
MSKLSINDNVGYLVKYMIDQLLLSSTANAKTFITVCLSDSLTSKKVLEILLHYLSSTYLNEIDFYDGNQNTIVSAVSGVVNTAVQGDESRVNHLINWCTSSSGAGLGDGVGIRRAVLAVLAQSKDVITTVFEKSLSQFGDELYIRHSPVLQQNGMESFRSVPRKYC